MRNHIPQEDTGRVIGLALVGWAAVVGLAAIEGVLAKLGPAELAAVAVFGLVYALATYLFDATIHAYVQKADLRLLAGGLAAIDVILVAAVVEVARHGLASITSLPLALAAFVLAPVALALHVAALESAAKPRVKRSAARSPGATPAAT